MYPYVYRKTAMIILLATMVGAPIGVFAVDGWLSWRGPDQNGVSPVNNLPDEFKIVDGNLLWTYDMQGRGSPVIADGRMYIWGYKGDNKAEDHGGESTPRAAQSGLREYLVELNPETGKEVWKQGFNDFLSDTVYERYSIGAPTVDSETGNVYLITTAGVVSCLTADGDLVWQYSMMERYGRMTFPNGRVGCVVIDGDLAITRGITSYWGADGPARDRFFGFDKKTGELRWSSTPGIQPHDSSFSTPVFEWRNGKRVFYVGTGCGNVVCVNAKNGDPIWRFHMSHGGVNSSPVIYGDKLIIPHGKENLDTSTEGRMIAVKLGAEPAPGEEAPKVLGPSYELWRNDEISMFTSSPTLVGNRVYQVDKTGTLHCLDADTGKSIWTQKLANSQLHASPLYADGKLYIPIVNGQMYILKPKADGCDVLCNIQLEGGAIGSPVAWNGKVYVHTTSKLYCFGTKGGDAAPIKWPEYKEPQPGKPVALQITPTDVLLNPGESQSFEFRELDANGIFVKDVNNAKMASFVPPTAKVKAQMDATVNDKTELVASKDAQISAGAFKAEADGLSGVIRGRVLPNLPYTENFDEYELSVPHAQESGVTFAYPPLPWIGARFKWEIRDLEGEKVLTKTLDNVLFQRAITFIGDPNASNYTVQADVRSDGNRRGMSNVGVINQRYFIALVGNWQQIEVSSNHERLKVGAPFKWSPNQWYRLKTRVDVNDDGSGMVRAKAWPRDEKEPDAWSIEAPHENAHLKGAPGLFGFALQSMYRVYIDNVVVFPNE